MANKKKIYKDFNLNDEVTVTVKVSDIICAIAEYASSEWSAPATTTILSEMQNEILDPIYRNEQEAAMQHNMDMTQAAAARFFGQTPDLPPNMDGS